MGYYNKFEKKLKMQIKVSILLLTAVLITGCFDNNKKTESRLPIKTAPSIQAVPVNNSSTINKVIDLQLVINNLVNQESVGGMNVGISFDIKNQNDDIDLSLYDSNGTLIAGYHDATQFKSADLIVSGAGLLPLTLKVKNMLNNNTSKVAVNFIVSGDHFFSNAVSFDISTNEALFYKQIEVLPKSVEINFPSSYVESILLLNNHITTADVNLSTAVKALNTPAGNILDSASVHIQIPANTAFFDDQGQPFAPIGAVTASAILLSADPKGISGNSQNPLFAFPGGLEVFGFEGALTPSDLNNGSEFNFISAGFVAIEIKDSLGNQVSQFSGEGINLSFEVPKSTINPQTSQPIQLADNIIPLWSYDEYSTKWSYEGDASIIAENQTTFTVSKNITHLSYYNLDWYGSERCQLNVDVVDSNGQANNQRLRVSFARKGGGWAYKPSGWGSTLEKLNIKRVPAFAGTFDLLDSQSNSLLASIEVDGETIEVPTGETGIALKDFCFGLTADNSKTFTAKLNIENPPRINLTPSIGLVCSNNNSIKETVTSGYFYLYEGYSYVQSGKLNSPTLSLSNLTEDAKYRLYYYSSGVRGKVEFTATSSLTELQIQTLSSCPTIKQMLHTQFVCVDDNQEVIKQKPANFVRYWAYDDNYEQYNGGTTDKNANASLDLVEGISYFTRAYTFQNNRYYGSQVATFTASSEQITKVNINLSNDHSFCTADLAIDYSKTSISANIATAPADATTKIKLTVQEKDEFANNRSSNSGSLSLNATPDGDISINNIQSNNDGTYSADISSATAGRYTISAMIDGIAINQTLNIEFVSALDVNQSTFSLSESVVAADGSTTTTATVTLRDFSGNIFVPRTGDVDFTLPATVNSSVITDNDTGVYTATFSSITAGSIDIIALFDGATISSNSVNFVPAFAISQSSFTLSDNSVVADGMASTTATVTLKDFNGNAYTPSSGTVSFTKPATLISSPVSDNGAGVYTATFTSTTAGSIDIVALFNGVTISSNTVNFTELAPSVSESTIVLDNNAVSFGNDITATITLKKADGSNYGKSAGTLTLFSAGLTFSNISDNSDGSYTATIGASSAGGYVITATVGSTELTTKANVTFTLVNIAASDISPATLTLNSGGPAGSIIVTLNQVDSSIVGHGGHKVVAEHSFFGIPLIAATISDNNDGTYDMSFSCLAGGFTAGKIDIKVDSIKIGLVDLTCL